MVISALTNLLNFKISTIQEKINIFSQIITLFFCIVLIGVHYIINHSKSKNKEKRRKLNWEANEETLEYMMYFILSFIIVFNSTILFLSAAFIIEFLRIAVYVRNFKQMKVSKKIYGFCMHLTWISYIFIHIILLALSHFLKDKPLTDKLNDIGVNLGMAVIFLIIFGGFIELLAILLSSLKGIIEGVIKLVRYFKKNKIST